MVTGFNPLDLLRRDMERVQKILRVPEPPPLLPRWSVSHPWKYHAVVYGFDYPGQILETDDFDYEPPLHILKTWARTLNIKEFGPIDGLRKSTIDKIVITGPEGFKKTVGRWELVA